MESMIFISLGVGITFHTLLHILKCKLIECIVYCILLNLSYFVFLVFLLIT